VRGKVTRVTPFGAFIELVPGVEGLLHVSELGGNAGAGGGGTGGGGRPVRDARDAVKPDAELMVTVISVDRERRRISLGLSGGDEPLDSDARAAVDRASAPARLGSLGDLLKTKLAGGPKR
jgi:small subunit ribosomal protein S1